MVVLVVRYNYLTARTHLRKNIVVVLKARFHSIYTQLLTQYSLTASYWTAGHSHYSHITSKTNTKRLGQILRDLAR